MFELIATPKGEVVGVEDIGVIHSRREGQIGRQDIRNVHYTRARVRAALPSRDTFLNIKTYIEKAGRRCHRTSSDKDGVEQLLIPNCFVIAGHFILNGELHTCNCFSSLTLISP